MNTVTTWSSFHLLTHVDERRPFRIASTMSPLGVLYIISNNGEMICVSRMTLIRIFQSKRSQNFLKETS